MRKIIILITLLIFSQSSYSIVKRHDVSPEQYQVKHAPAYLIDMPHEGHGVLIAPNWILTVSHVIFYDYTGKKITIAGQDYVIDKVIKHKNYKTPEKFLTKGDAKPLMDFMKTNNDIALVKLRSNVVGIQPIALYPSSDERGRIITAFGRGSTGDGLKGSVFKTKKQKTLRIMNNMIEEAEGNWISITFDSGENALALEGIDGSGDSGGPLVIHEKAIPYLVGMFSWDYVEGDLASFKPGQYGNSSYQVRISSYRKWIQSHIANN